MIFRKNHNRIFEEENEAMSLQVTSMVDVFAILLVFLLKSFTSGLATAAPTEPLTLPSVNVITQSAPIEVLTLEVSSSAVLLDRVAVTELKAFGYQNETTFQKTIHSALMRKRMMNSKREPAAVDSNLILLADEAVPYSTLKPIMNAAAQSGYVDLQLVVRKAE